MSDVNYMREERRLRALFGQQDAPAVDEIFVADVMRRVRGALWARRILLGFALAAGLAIAVLPLSTAVVEISELMTGALDRWFGPV